MSMTLQGQTGLRPSAGLGVSSFAVGAIGTLSFVLLLGWATIDKSESTKPMLGAGLVMVWIINLIGIGLGIAGVVKGSSNKTLSILGLVLNGGIVVISAALIAIALRLP
jgi:hypothetical protein